jgi:hypothetical protein
MDPTPLVLSAFGSMGLIESEVGDQEFQVIIFIFEPLSRSSSGWSRLTSFEDRISQLDVCLTMNPPSGPGRDP